MSFDVNSLVLGEIAKVEELSGQSVAQLGEDFAPKGKMMAALCFVVRKRQDPKYTWNQALALSMADAQAILGMEPETEPDPAAEPAASLPAAPDPANPYGLGESSPDPI